MFQDEQLNSIIEGGVIPTFKIVPQYNEFRSKASGQKEFDNVEMVHIRVPGDPKTEVVEPVTQMHMDRFPRTYEAFKKNQQLTGGTPLETLNDLDPASIAKLKSMNIFTVEQLAGIHDGLTSNLGANGRQLRAKAQEFISKHGDTTLADTLSAQEKRIQELEAALRAAKAEEPENPDQPEPQPRKPGRPKLTIPPHMQGE